MKILFLSTRLPHADITGGHVIVYQRILRLARRGHEIGLAVFASEDDDAHVDEMRPLVKRLEIIPPPRRTAAGDLLSFLTRGIPPYFRHYRSPEMMRRVGDMVDRERYHVAMAEFTVMGQYLYRNPFLPAVRRVVSCHSGIATTYRKLADILGYRPRGIRSRLSLAGLLRYEVDLYRNVDRILVLTAQERYGLLNYAPDLRISVIPGGVDTSHVVPPPRRGDETELLFTGHFEQEANRDAVFWFLRTAWPRLKERIPGVRFKIVGPGSDEALRARARRDPALVVTGGVPDLRPHFATASVFVCPVRLGSGLRLKVLEAMAAGVPVVTTSLGAEGIPIQQGESGFVADRPEMMADYIELLMGDAALRHTLSRQGRALVETRFSWDLGVDQIEEVMGETCTGGMAHLHI
jgi:hypothetical protein